MAMVLLSAPATLSADDCTDTCGALLSQSLFQCDDIEQSNLAICNDNHQIDELECEYDQLQCELRCLEGGGEECDCLTPYLACLVQAGQALSACQQAVQAARASCGDNADLQYTACLNDCTGYVFIDGFESGNTSGWSNAAP